MKLQGLLNLMAGVVIGYCLMQGLALLQTRYLWTLFYHS